MPSHICSKSNLLLTNFFWSDQVQLAPPTFDGIGGEGHVRHLGVDGPRHVPDFFRVGASQKDVNCCLWGLVAERACRVARPAPGG
uniref:Uncharacterized protein n=1 Tax=Triticum urartu TaxID=4572 RepID=A0A8R7P9G6_TRIUA